jgi:hypothetical protein
MILKEKAVPLEELNLHKEVILAKLSKIAIIL